MELKNNITIVTATDNHYIVLLAALIKSIEVNHKTIEQIDLYVVGDKLSKSNIEKLTKSFNASRVVIHWVKMEDIIPGHVKLPLDKSSYPLNIYMRLFIPYFLPKDIEKIIYLDVDMIVLEDISKLWYIDLKDNIVGAVTDLIKIVSNPWGGIKNYEALGIDKDAKYFNTGLLLMDRRKWEEEDVTHKVLECIENNKQFANFPDQYGLNIVLYKKWLELDPLWNCFSNLEYKKPNIIHFNHRKPIYKTYDKNQEYRSIFYTYLHQTEWKNYEPIGEGRRYLKKIRNILEKRLKALFS